GPGAPGGPGHRPAAGRGGGGRGGRRPHAGAGRGAAGRDGAVTRKAAGHGERRGLPPPPSRRDKPGGSPFPGAAPLSHFLGASTPGGDSVLMSWPLAPLYSRTTPSS